MLRSSTAEPAGLNANDIVQKIWTLCNVLRDDGITYHQYVSELTYLLFLKMAQARGAEIEKQIPTGYRWKDLRACFGSEQLSFYTNQLQHLGMHGPKRVSEIFANARTSIRNPRNLAILVDAIDQLDWFNADRAQFGELYDGLLEKNAGEKESGAGQYFTPRPLISSMVAVIQPQLGDVVQDPAAGTGGFLIEADNYIKQHHTWSELSPRQREFQKTQAFVGAEIVSDTHRLCLMNMMLHDIDSDVRMGNTLSDVGRGLPPADVVLSNPPFGTMGGGFVSSRDDFPFNTSNKQLNFLMHIYLGLKKPSGRARGGRAAVVVSDNVLFQQGTSTAVRQHLMDRCNLHTILRLPSGVLYSTGVKASVLFFSRERAAQGATREIWVYDMRTNMPSINTRTPLTREHFREFEQVFGPDPWGRAQRHDQGLSERFRRFTREEIRAHGDNLDISWLRDATIPFPAHADAPEQITDQILLRLRSAVMEVEGLRDLLVGEDAPRKMK